MDLSCIISSGDLELYILGMLPEEEARKIEQLALLFPEIQEELDRIQDTLLALPEQDVPLPSPGVKENLMQQFRALKAEEEEERPRLRAVPVIPVSEDPEPAVTPAPTVSMEARRRSGTPAWLVAAVTTGLLISIGVNVYLASQRTADRQQLASVQNDIRNLQTRQNVQQEQLTAYRQTLAMMHDDTYRKIRLTSVPGKPNAYAQIYWNTRTKEVFVEDISLPQTPDGKQYQLWAIVDGQPVDAGLLQDAKQAAQKMKTFPRADAFAITLEKAGGSPTPDLEAMYVMSKT